MVTFALTQSKDWISYTAQEIGRSSEDNGKKIEKT
jgi:hypothetical protein